MKRLTLWIFIMASATLIPTLEAAERIFFTARENKAESMSKQPAHGTQIWSMTWDGKDLQQHTRNNSSNRQSICQCNANDEVFYQKDETTLARLRREGDSYVEETIVSTPGIQYHTPHCSDDGKYITITAWNKKSEKPQVELYDLSTKKKLQQWEGENASWLKGEPTIIYKQHNAPDGVGVIDVRLAKPEGDSKIIYTQKIGPEGPYDLQDPQLINSDPKNLLFRIYDEHEYFYYFQKLGNQFVLTRNKQPLYHHDVYTGDESLPREPLEQGQLVMAPNGHYAVMTEQPWNTPPSVYLIDLNTRDSWEIAKGFNPVWSKDSSRIFFNHDPNYYALFLSGKGPKPFEVFPATLEGYEIYVYILGTKETKRLTNDDKYQGFL